MAANVFRPYNYADVARRWFAAGYDVFLPATIWNSFYDDESGDIVSPTARGELDLLARGGGVTLFGTEIAAHRIAVRQLATTLGSTGIWVCGLSFGALVAIALAALMPDVAGAVSSCGLLRDRADGWMLVRGGWMPQSRTLYRALLALIAPRPLYLELGKYDEIVPLDVGESFADLAFPYWESRNELSELAVERFDGGHEFNLDGAIPRISTRDLRRRRSAQ